MTKRFGLLVTGLIVSLAVVGSVAYGFSVVTQPKTAVVAQSVPKPVTKAELLTLVNAERAKNGVAPLVEDTRLDESAQMKADDEVNYHYFGHISPNDGKHGYDYINTTGIACASDSENLTQNIPGRNTSEQAVYSWIKSPAHHAAMIDAKYSLTGFGINGNQVVEHFCQQ